MDASTWLSSAVGVCAVGLGLVAVGVWLRTSTIGSRRRLVVGEVLADAGVALTTGAVVGVVLFMAAQSLEQGLADAQERSDDVRFVRELTGQPGSKPFNHLDLSGRSLSVLDFSCADMFGADLSDAGLFQVNFSGAHLAYADLSDAVLAQANLTNADLRGANLSGADLDHAILEGVVYNDATVWPEGFDPPATAAEQDPCA